MIEGIKVLSEIPIYSTQIDFLICWIIAIVVLIGVAALGTFALADKIEEVPGYLLLALFLAASAFFGSTKYFTKQVETGRFQYKVEIEDRVSFNDFEENYIKIDKEGKIYTIELLDKGEQK